MKIETIPSGAFATNCYILEDQGNRVDFGSNGQTSENLGPAAGSGAGGNHFDAWSF